MLATRPRRSHHSCGSPATAFESVVCPKAIETARHSMAAHKKVVQSWSRFVWMLLLAGLLTW